MSENHFNAKHEFASLGARAAMTSSIFGTVISDFAYGSSLVVANRVTGK
jgi:hypothetical protein